ncbi:ABC transporter permease subunit [bacterium]|nr:ABC transporter permease subunit [bacterium]
MNKLRFNNKTNTSMLFFRMLRFLLVFVGLIMILMLFAWLTKPDLSSNKIHFSKEELKEVEEFRSTTLDTNHHLRLQVDVDYSKGKSAPWFPKGEAPILHDLVDEGKLPPVAERVGPEPCVIKGVDGVGKYGGTWQRLNGLVLGGRMSYCGFVRFSPQGFPIVPHLAKSWEVSDNYKKWTFYLRKGVKWSDGYPFTSADIKYCWDHEINCHEISGNNMLKELLTANGKYCKLICYSNNPYKVTFLFPEPKGLFLALLATSYGSALVNSPEHYLRKYHPLLGAKKLIEEGLENTKLPSARALYFYLKSYNNPYHPRLWPWVVRTYKANPPETAVRNPYYWVVDEKGNQLPYIDRVLSEQVSDDTVVLRAAAGGASFQFRYIGYEYYTYLMEQRKAGDYKIYHWYPGDSSEFAIQFNLNRFTDSKHPEWMKKRKLVRNKHFRQALSLAIDRKAIIKAVYNNQAVPMQVAPCPESPFYDEHTYKAFTEYDPERASKLLDQIGLTNYDAEGYRTFKDKSPIIFYLDYPSGGMISSEPVQFVVHYWKQIGVRVIPRERQRVLWEVERVGLLHDMNVWTGNDEYYPVIEPRFFAPVGLNCFFAQANAKWYTQGGMNGNTNAAGPGSEPLETNEPLYKAILAYQDACKTADLKEQVKAFKPALEIAAENVWSINIAKSPAVLCVVRNYMRNVPKTAIASWDFQSPGNAGIETFYMTKSNNSPSAIKKIKREIVKPVGSLVDFASENKVDNKARHKTFLQYFLKTLKYILIIAAIALLILIAAKHPYIAKRLLIMIPTLLIISVIVFTVIQLPPGDFITSKIIQLKASGDTISEQIINETKEQFYLNKSMPERYLRWMGFYWFTTFDSKDKGLLEGNLGRSMETGKVVNDIIGDRLILTILISLGTILFTWIIAVPIGIYSAIRQYSIGDYILTFFGFIGMCIPAFLLALLMMYFSYKFFGINITGLLSPEFAMQPEWNWPKIKDLLQHIWLPVVVLGMGGTAGMIRVMRANLLDELKKPYVVTARAKGVRPVKLLLKYPVRLALNPFISGIGGIFPQLISGGAIVAIVLSLPTVGPLMLTALMTEDMYLAGSLLMVLSLLGVIGTLVSDLLLLILDPRIRMEGGSR